MPIEQYPEHGGLEVEDDRVTRWRLDQFSALGFGEEQAWILAGSEADLQVARALVAAGCPLHLVAQIVV